MQEMKEELGEEKNKRLTLQVSEACLEFCMDSFVMVPRVMTVLKLFMTLPTQEEVNSLKAKH